MKEDAQTSREESEYDEEKNMRSLERFFNGPFNNFIFKAKYVIIGLFVIWSGISVWQTTNLSPLTEEESFLPEDHWIMQAFTVISEKFNAG